ncbi:MAG: hypothetical protein GY765_27880, partial [bacterium]|nr:hypothetical protein [bacterium]
TSNYLLELEKLKILMGVEKDMFENVGPPADAKIEIVREQVEKHWNKEFKRFQDLEGRLQEEMTDNIRLFKYLSLSFPSTFYQSVGSEISSKGFENFIVFFQHVRQLKQQFIRFIIDKKYYGPSTKQLSADGKPVIESFIKNDENVFYADCRLPGGFGRGIFLTLLYSMLLFYTAYVLFKKSLRLQEA